MRISHPDSQSYPAWPQPFEHREWLHTLCKTYLWLCTNLIMVRGEPQLQTKRRNATQVLSLQFLGIDMVVDVDSVFSGIPSQFLDQLSPHAAPSEHSREPVPEAVRRESAFYILALGIVEAETFCVLGDYLVDGMGAESRAGFSDEQGSFLWILQIGISSGDPGP